MGLWPKNLRSTTSDESKGDTEFGTGYVSVGQCDAETSKGFGRSSRTKSEGRTQEGGYSCHNKS